MKDHQLPPPAPLSVKEPPFKQDLKKSMYFHLALLGFVLLNHLVFPGSPIKYNSVLKVDLVGLPDQLKKDLKNTPPPPSSAEPQKTPEKTQKPSQDSKKIPEMIDRSAKMKSALSRIKSLEKIAQEEAKNSKNKNLPSFIIKGNQLSKGSSLTGEASESAEQTYIDLIRERLQQNWTLPVWLARQNLSARIQIFLDSRGYVIQTKWITSSGNAQFDQTVKETIQKSQPLPAPPSDLLTNLQYRGILVGFPL